eukprot:g6399.t1
MVQFSEESPFLDEGDGTAQSAVCSQHVRSLGLLKTIVQVDTFLAAVLVLTLLVGKGDEQIVRDEDKVQVILQVVTCSVFLASVAHTVVLMVCTGWRYTLAWYDPLFPAASSAFGFFLLYVTIADAVLIRLRPREDLDTVGYWMVVIFGLMMPMAFAGPTATLQMVLHKRGLSSSKTLHVPGPSHEKMDSEPPRRAMAGHDARLENSELWLVAAVTRKPILSLQQYFGGAFPSLTSVPSLSSLRLVAPAAFSSGD